MRPTRIGLSLSGCVLDILRGTVELEQVIKIIAGVRCVDADAWERVISGYMESYWVDFNREDVDRIIGALTIEQPRLINNYQYPLLYNGRWVSDESQIVWSTDDH